jgi:hypothetical protein
MQKSEKLKLAHNFSNSFTSIRIIVQSNIIFIKELSQKHLLSLSNEDSNALSIFESSMETVLEELHKVEEIFNELLREIYGDKHDDYASGDPHR